jgi:hypothetical protein
MSKFTGIPFTCQCCQGKFYRLTERFEPTPPMRGDYVELLPQYGPSGYNWYDFPHTEWTIGDNVACVQCGEPIRMEHVLQKAVEELERLRTQASSESNISGHQDVQGTQAQDGVVLQGDVLSGGSNAGVVVGGSVVSDVNRGDAGMYDEVDLEDGLLASVLRMTAEGETQAVIAETCGISVYRVRKLQNGDLK